MTSRHEQPARSSQPSTLDMMQSPAFRQAVERVASWKCMQAVRAGKLRMVTEDPNPHTRFIPRMDMIDDSSSQTVSAVFELPGIKTSDIALHIRDGNLIVMGERRSPYPSNAIRPSRAQLPHNPLTAADAIAAGEMDTGTDTGAPTTAIRLPVHELRFGSFHRSIRVPEGIKESQITAGLQDGMLTVTWPRSPTSRTSSSGDTMTPPTSITTTAATSQ
ncbi:HSP20-like chaperone [Crucibulum laeve]|uniref:HSP20-like chaperone n=1 Tax=Crucibulum laeve TaxID=68775 RepID=A0A5C3LEF5_9AGAR|nr:HSP20-like chaperone [Crucibulum laeve]